MYTYVHSSNHFVQPKLCRSFVLKRSEVYCKLIIIISRVWQCHVNEKGQRKRKLVWLRRTHLDHRYAVLLDSCTRWHTYLWNVWDCVLMVADGENLCDGAPKVCGAGGRLIIILVGSHRIHSLRISLFAGAFAARWPATLFTDLCRVTSMRSLGLALPKCTF